MSSVILELIHVSAVVRPERERERDERVDHLEVIVGGR